MKKLLIKIPAVIAMVITLFSLFWFVQSFSAPEYDIWLISVIAAMLSVAFYIVDAVIAFIKARKNEDTRFNYLLAIVMVGAIPMVGIFGGRGIVAYNIIWNVYYILMFVLEAISIKKVYDSIKADKAK